MDELTHVPTLPKRNQPNQDSLFWAYRMDNYELMMQLRLSKQFTGITKYVIDGEEFEFDQTLAPRNEVLGLYWEAQTRGLVD